MNKNWTNEGSTGHTNTLCKKNLDVAGQLADTLKTAYWEYTVVPKIFVKIF